LDEVARRVIERGRSRRTASAPNSFIVSLTATPDGVLLVDKAAA
jgi:hypothetical protein